MIGQDVQKMEVNLRFGDPALLPPQEYLAPEPDDCSSCADPCTDHKQFPSSLYIDQVIPMLGSVDAYARHIIIATGLSNWPPRILKEKNTVAYSLYHAGRRRGSSGWNNMISNSSLVSYYSTVPDSCDVIIYPDNIIVSNVTCDTADDFYDLFLSTDLPKEPLDIELINKDDRLVEMKVQKNPYRTMMLLCSHGRVDKRCGVTAPILAYELDQVLREKNLDEHDAGILMVSHIGGHQITGNVICYIDEEETIIQGKIIKDLYRGAMDKSFKNQVGRSMLRW
ncbi:hypothetical protein INT48_006364 [Thamnidium elegans]|uniref:Sucrase n=1 Tax=Thamnidium elegans TaxID=101142 RepID=A0A8H7SMF7_9FUNG|nr:hypothetical protein INT48_006364 [Thamnidium elegans]